MVGSIQRYMKLWKQKHDWRKKNPRNFTWAESMFVINHVSVGDYTYGPLNIEHYYKKANLTIGRYCSIAKNVRFLLGGEHGTRAITTYPFGSRIYGSEINAEPKETLKWKVDIVVEDDVWIGYDSLILPGVTIGRGSVIGARSVVTKDIPPYSIYAGTRVVRKRFSEAIIERLMALDYDKIEHYKGDMFSKLWNADVTEENIDEIVSAFQN